MPQTRPYIGGQAVIEGVMMRSPRSFSVVVRRRSGQLVVRERGVPPSEEAASPGSVARKPISRWPFIRGVTTLVESLRLGSEALRFSSAIYEADLEAAEAEEQKGRGGGGSGSSAGTLLSVLVSMAELAVGMGTQGDDPPTGSSKSPGRTNKAGDPGEQRDPKDGAGETAKRATSWVMVGFFLALFIALPQAAAGLLNRVGGWGLDLRSSGFQAMTGGFKLVIVIGYLLLIRRIPEIYRVFQYHGAEHKTISTYEAQEPLVVERARAKSTLHPRCGTTFLVMVALVSVFVFSAAAPLLPHLPVGGVAEHALLFLLKLPFLPVIAGLTFELQRLSARFCTRGWRRALLWPGFLVQKITTIEPDDRQLEVALASLGVTLWREASEGPAPLELERTFDGFESLMAQPAYGPTA